MDQLFPVNKLDKQIPVVREKRESSERESNGQPLRTEDARKIVSQETEDEDLLYEDVPYEGGPAGKHLNTFA
ncbi:MAG: hypothetical protein AAGB46_16360 [Verrucomicrobiota bacterium]